MKVLQHLHRSQADCAAQREVLTEHLSWCKSSKSTLNGATCQALSMFQSVR